MQIFRIQGGHALVGVTRIPSAKNTVLPLLAASVMVPKPVRLLDCPHIDDVKSMCQMLRSLGCSAEWIDDQIHVDATFAQSGELPPALFRRIRSSIFLLGPLLARFGQATVTYPGGCEIGMRPIDLHLKGLQALGVEIEEQSGMIYCRAKKLVGQEVHLDYPSVGATENVMMAAVLAQGTTVIHNAAREPEITDLIEFLNLCGADIRLSGSTILIQGVQALRGATYRPISDRILAGTYLAAAAITGGSITIENARENDLKAILGVLKDMGCAISVSPGSISLSAPSRLQAIGLVETQPHPGFPTDMQAQLVALATIAEGTSVVVENVFENRYGHVPELVRMGANIVVKDRTAIIRGVKTLHGAQVVARDLRAGAALVMAGMAARGVTEVEGVGLVDRGYPSLEKVFTALGANVERI